MKISIGNRVYTYLKGYQKDSKFRAAFNSLVAKIFGFTFEAWYRAGYWNDKYIPYTLFDGERAVANVSVNIMDFMTFGESQRYIQIGTAMTDKNYRGKNLSKFLIEKVLDEWNRKCDFIYLYANKSVLEFYPKFGFNPVREYQYTKRVEHNAKPETLEQLNMDRTASRDKLYDYAKNTKGFGNLSMKENADLVMFYAIYTLKESVYYIKSMDVIVIATFNNTQIQLWDVFGKEAVDLDKIISFLANRQMKEIWLGFTPDDRRTYQVRQLTGGDVLFVQKGKTELFDQNKIMFPLLSHA